MGPSLTPCGPHAVRSGPLGFPGQCGSVPLEAGSGRTRADRRHLLALELVRLIDPRWLQRRPAEGGAPRTETEGAREIVECLIISFVAVLHLGVLLLGAGVFRESTRVLAVLMDTFLIVLGNFIGRVRPNWFIGIRTPWTLSSDDVWRRTHRLAARFMVGLGLLFLPLIMVLSDRVVLGASLVALLAAGLLPAAWSYVYWRRAV